MNNMLLILQCHYERFKTSVYIEARLCRLNVWSSGANEQKLNYTHTHNPFRGSMTVASA